MKQRIITACIAIACFVPILYFSHLTAVWLPTCLILCAVAVFEMQKCIGTLKKISLSAISFFASLGMVTISAFVPATTFPLYAFAIITALLLLSFFVSVFSKSTIDVESAVMSAMTTTYLAVSFSAFVLVRANPQGIWLFLLIFFFPWVTDTFAYFCGVAFGRHKLIPDVSPKKSVEGAVGGILFAVLFAIGYIYLIQKTTGDFAGANYFVWALSAALLSVLSQCGDLTASLIKRRYQIKDYGNLFPGHGGVLDRFDSVLPCATCFYFLLLFGVL